MLALSFAQGIEDAWADVATFVPKLGGALLTLLVGWFVARALRRGTRSVLRMVRFDELVDRSGLGQWVDRVGTDDASGLLAKLVFAAAMLISLELAVEVLGQSQLQVAVAGVLAFLPRLAAAVLIVVVTGLAAAKVGEITRRALAKVSYGPAASSGSAAAVWIIGGFAAVDQLGVAQNIVTTLFQAGVYTVGMILVIKFGVGGVASARDRFWPKVYDRVQGPLPQRPAAAPVGPRGPLPPGAPAGYYGYPVNYPPPGWVPVQPRPNYPPGYGGVPYPGGPYPGQPAPGQPAPGQPAQGRPGQQFQPGQPGSPAQQGQPAHPGQGQPSPSVQPSVAAPVTQPAPAGSPGVDPRVLHDEIDLRNPGGTD